MLSEMYTNSIGGRALAEGLAHLSQHVEVEEGGVGGDGAESVWRRPAQQANFARAVRHFEVY